MLTKETDFKSIISLNSELNKIQDLDLLLERILFEARKAVRADAGSIYVKRPIYDKGGYEDTLSIKYAQNDTIERTLPPGQKMLYSVYTIPIDETSIAGYCALSNKIINIPDMYDIAPNAPYSFNSDIDKAAGYKTISALTFPLNTADGRLLGVIQVINGRDDRGDIVPFTKDDEFLVTHFVTHATVALQRAYVNRAMVLRMIKMSELRDPKETGAHVNRVASYSVEIYDRWAYNHNVPNHERERFRDWLKIGSMLHDVGKVAISDTILKKPGRFTSEEFAVMQQHSQLGAALFSDPQSPFDIMAKEVALTHHENWDGTGYPGWIDPESGTPIRTDENSKVLGRKGVEIPLTGRIVAIADVFDALCSKRVYKEAWDIEKALAEMRKMTGTKFDPELMDIFFEILPVIKQIQELYPEQ
ncbi:MAG: HD domain-containing protein [Chitinispirillales bacterium]|nr:HD domain-containing protein [Chitinispirillales bacterium]